MTVARPSLDDVYLRYAGRTFDAAEAETDDPRRRRQPMKALQDTWLHDRPPPAGALRQPWWIAVTLVQP